MVKKKTNLDDLLKEIKDNSLNLKAEEIESSDILSEENIQLEGTKGRIKKLEKKGKFLKKIQDIIGWLFLLSIPGGAIPFLILLFLPGSIGHNVGYLFMEQFWNSPTAEIFWISLIIWGIIVVSSFILSFIVIVFVYDEYSIDRERRKLNSELIKIESSIERIKRELKSEITKKRVLDLIEEGGIKFNERDFSNALKVFERAQEILRTSPAPQEIQNILESKIRLVQENLNELKIREIDPIIEQGNLLKNQKLKDKAIEVFKNALEITNNLFKFPERDQKIKEIKSLIDAIYLNKIKEINAKGNQLRNQNKFDRAIQTFRNALQITDNIYSSSKRKKEIQNIENLINQAYSDKINEKIKTGNQLRKQMKFDESIKTFNKGLNLTKKMYDSREKNNEISEIKSLINQSKIAKIKNTILNLGTKFGRLHIMEISEECGEVESLIISTVREMIEGSEIYAKYFESSKWVAFDQQANIKEIDKLMEQYQQWEKEGISKK